MKAYHWWPGGSLSLLDTTGTCIVNLWEYQYHHSLCEYHSPELCCTRPKLLYRVTWPWTLRDFCSCFSPNSKENLLFFFLKNLYVFYSVKIKETSFKWSWEALKRVLSSTATHCSLHSSTGRNLLFTRQQEERFPPSSAAGQPLPLWTPTLLQWTFLQNSPSQLPPFLYKRTFFSFTLQTCLWYAIVCISRIAIPLLVPNKLILLVA